MTYHTAENITPAPSKRSIWASIAASVAAAHDTTAAAIMGRSRCRPIAYARHAAWYALRLATGWGLAQMARIIGVDHSSIIHGLQGHCQRNGIEYVGWRDKHAVFKSVRA